MNVAKNKNNNMVWPIILFMYGINLFNIGWYIPVIFFPYWLLGLLRSNFNKKFVQALYIMSLFFVVYASFLMIYGYETKIQIIGKVFYSIYFFVLGYLLINPDIKLVEVYKYLIIVIMSNTLFTFLSVRKTISIFGSMDYVIKNIGRIGINMWGNNVIASTILNFSISFGLAMLPAIMTPSRKQHRLIYLLLITSFVMSIYSVLKLGNRTGIIIFFASFLIFFLTSDKNYKEILSNLLSWFFLFLILYTFYRMDLLGFRTTFENSYTYNRFFSSSLLEDSRIDIWKKSFVGILEHPFGGKLTKMGMNTAHNLWLQVGYESGIVPFFLLILLTGMAIKSLLVFIKTGYPVLLKRIVLGMYIAFFISFMAEPVFLGGMAYFAMFCLVYGLIEALNYNSIKINNNSI